MALAGLLLVIPSVIAIAVFGPGSCTVRGLVMLVAGVCVVFACLRGVFSRVTSTGHEAILFGGFLSCLSGITLLGVALIREFHGR